MDDGSFADAKHRVETALAFVKALTREQVNGAEDKTIAWTAGGNERITTAYDILRHRGVPVGKRDFLGPVNWL
jgi:hypothetical protein